MLGVIIFNNSGDGGWSPDFAQRATLLQQVGYADLLLSDDTHYWEIFDSPCIHVQNPFQERLNISQIELPCVKGQVGKWQFFLFKMFVCFSCSLVGKFFYC